jgi:hypothetical protein
MGVILYISSVNDEVAHRQKSDPGGSTPADPLAFSYHYGWAFVFGAATFVSAMVAAVSNISLYLRAMAAAGRQPGQPDTERGTAVDDLLVSDPGHDPPSPPPTGHEPPRPPPRRKSKSECSRSIAMIL